MADAGSALRRIAEAALKFRALILVGAVALAVFGVVQLPKTPVSMLPEFAPPTVEIQTEALGLSAAEVEQLITVPLEADLLNGVAWLDEIRSESIPGLSSIELVFEPGTDVMRARQVVAERLTQAHALPNVSKPPAMLQPLSSTSRVMMISLSSDELSTMELSVLARWQIRPYLMGVPGVANVSIWGQRERQLQVRVDPAVLEAKGVTLGQVIETTGNALWVSPLSFVEASTPGTGGFFDTPNQRLSVQHISPITDAAGLSQVTVVDTGDRIVRLGDVASVVEDHQPLIGDAVLEGAPGLILVVERFPDVSTLQVSEDVEDAMADLVPGLPGVTVDTEVYRPAGFLETGLSNLGLAFLIGLALLALVVGAAFRSWRSAVVSVVSIGLSVTAALAVLYLFDTTVNVMVLAGLVIALAVIVDDSIVDLDAVRRRMREHPDSDQSSRMGVIVGASAEIRRPLVAATVIVVGAAVPTLLLPGLTGEFAGPFVLAYSLAVSASLLMALILSPVLALLLLRRPEPEPPRLVLTVQRRYGDVLSRFVSSGRPVYAAVAVGGILALTAIALTGDRQMLPTFREPTLLIQWDGPPGTSHPEMARISARAGAELAAIPGVNEVGGQVGRAITSDQVVGVNSGELWVTIDDDADYDETVAAVESVVEGYPGVFHQLRTYPDEQLQEVRTGTAGDVVVRVYGQDLDTLETKAEELRAAFEGIDGVVDPHVDYDPVEPTVEVEVDLTAAEANQINPGDVRRAAATLLSGIEVGSLFEEQKVFEVVVWGTPEIRNSVTSIEDLLIDRPEGGQVRLGDVASVEIEPNPNVVRRESVSRRVDIVADVDGRDLGDVEDDVAAAIEEIEFPVEYHATVISSGSSGAWGDRDLWAAGLAAAMAAFLILQALFGSWRLAALASLTLPIALAGGALVAGAAGGPLTLAGGLALLAVLGFAVRQAAVLVTSYQSRAGAAEPGRASVVGATQERFVPVVASALATAALLLPVLLLGDRPGLEMVRPIAAVVLCGLVTATLSTLFLIPALCLRFGAVEVGHDSGSPSERGLSS